MKERAQAMLRIARIFAGLTDAEQRLLACEVMQAYGASVEELFRERERDRKRMQRDESLAAILRGRDGDLCRYCGREVDWINRRSLRGAVFDHIDSRKGEVPGNLVLACRSCNSKKRDRTPEDAGMPILPPGTRLGPDTLGLLSGTSDADCPGQNAPNGTVSPTPPPPGVVFQVPESIRTALGKCEFLGKRLLWSPAQWRSEIRAFPGVDYAKEVLEAEAWCQTNVERRPKKRVGQFMHRWLRRASGEE